MLFCNLASLGNRFEILKWSVDVVGENNYAVPISNNSPLLHSSCNEQVLCDSKTFSLGTENLCPLHAFWALRSCIFSQRLGASSTPTATKSTSPLLSEALIARLLFILNDPLTMFDIANPLVSFVRVAPRRTRIVRHWFVSGWSNLVPDLNPAKICVRLRSYGISHSDEKVNKFTKYESWELCSWLCMQDPSWVEDLVDIPKWRPVLFELYRKHPQSVLLQFANAVRIHVLHNLYSSSLSVCAAD